MLFHQGRFRRIYYTPHEQQPAKIFPPLIEEKLKKHHQVVGCCVVGRKQNDSTSNEAVAYMVIDQKNDEIQDKIVDELQKISEEELPTYMQPVEYRFIEELPHTPIGKVDLRKLEEWAARRL